MAIGGIITTGNHPKSHWPGIHAFWGQVYDEWEEQYSDLFDLETSQMAYEEDVEVTGFGLPQVKTEAGPGAFDSEIQGATTRYVHVAYSLGWICSYEEIQDNLYPKLATRRTQANAISMRQGVETIGAGFFNRGFNTSFPLADGQPLFSSAHPFPTGGSYSNVLTPAADLSESSLEDACVQLMGFTTSRGVLLNARPMSLHVAPKEWFNANRILMSVLQNDTANNAVNVLKATNAFPNGIKKNVYFQSPHAWFLRTNVLNGLQFFWRERPSLANDNDFPTKNAMALSYMRFSLGCSDTRAALGSNGP